MGTWDWLWSASQLCHLSNCIKRFGPCALIPSLFLLPIQCLLLSYLCHSKWKSLHSFHLHRSFFSPPFNQTQPGSSPNFASKLFSPRKSSVNKDPHTNWCSEIHCNHPRHATVAVYQSYRVMLHYANRSEYFAVVEGCGQIDNRYERRWNLCHLLQFKGWRETDIHVSQQRHCS